MPLPAETSRPVGLVDPARTNTGAMRITSFTPLRKWRRSSAGDSLTVISSSTRIGSIRDESDFPSIC